MRSLCAVYRIKNEAITEKATEIKNTITSLTTELNKTLAKLGNNVNEKTAPVS